MSTERRSVERIRDAGPSVGIESSSAGSWCWPAAAAARTCPTSAARELRARVEQLKKEIQAEPTTAANVVARNEVLWPWANALGAAGFEIPVDLPLHCALVRWAAADGGEPELPPGLDLPLAVHVQRVDHYLRELALKEDHPGALGRLAFDRSEPLVSASWSHLEESYTSARRRWPKAAASWWPRPGWPTSCGSSTPIRRRPTS